MNYFKRLPVLLFSSCLLLNLNAQDYSVEAPAPAPEDYFAQEVSETPTRTTKKIVVYVTKLDQARTDLQRFLKQHNAVVYKTDQDVYDYTTTFKIGVDQLQSLDSLAGKLGYILQNTFNTEDYTENIESLKARIASLNRENERLNQQLTDTVLYDEDAKDEIIRRIVTNNETLAEDQDNIKSYEESAKDNNKCYVEISLRDEMSTPNNSIVSFVNMPGIEYNYLWIENPKAGLSSAAYQGVAIKYMFTRGKSYFNLGNYKSVNNNRSDTSLINELFVINFGQDFYPKHFGRGGRKFLNLYTGYQVGGFITHRNNEKNAAFIPNLNLNLGLEIFKSKHVLIDNKVSYFLPLSDINHDMRGLMYSASFNFVF